jgi:hypothetical protein
MRRARLLSQDRLQLPILTECYKVAAYNAANKLASVPSAADPSVPAEPSAPVVVAGR